MRRNSPVKAVTMKNLIVYILVAAAALGATACKQGNGLAEKKAKLTQLKEQAIKTEAEIKLLQNEVDRLDPKKANEAKVIPVGVTTLAEEPFRHFIDIQGTVEAEDNLLVTPSAMGKITRVNVKVGQQVSKGQLLAVVDNSVMVQSLDEIKTGLELATTLYNKQKQLWDQKIGSEIQFLNAKTNKESLERKLETLKTQIALTNVIAPVSGTVDLVTLKVGEMPAPGAGIRVVNLADLKVTAKLSDTYIASVKVGDEVDVRLPDLNEQLKARITFVGQVVDPISRTFGIEIRITEGREHLRPNMIAITKINDRTDLTAIVIQQNLVQNTEQGNIVFVATEENGKQVARIRNVKFGQNYGGKTEITEGLKAGDKLVTTGYQDLVDGTPLKY